MYTICKDQAWKTDSDSVSCTCTAEQSDMIGCQQPMKPWPKYQRVWHETGLRGHDLCGLKWLRGHSLCVCVKVCSLTWICCVQSFPARRCYVKNMNWTKLKMKKINELDALVNGCGLLISLWSLCLVMWFARTTLHLIPQCWRCSHVVQVKVLQVSAAK